MENDAGEIVCHLLMETPLLAIDLLLIGERHQTRTQTRVCPPPGRRVQICLPQKRLRLLLRGHRPLERGQPPTGRRLKSCLTFHLSLALWPMLGWETTLHILCRRQVGGPPQRRKVCVQTPHLRLLHQQTPLHQNTPNRRKNLILIRSLDPLKNKYG